ncbi:ABC transporter permease [Natronorubrum sp. FCH18a]|uniref:ABC transporter permease n=1 Tax=Natronorubrum sp. FCH18a TaxID=3447018 RepID=UPI003F50DF61
MNTDRIAHTAVVTGSVLGFLFLITPIVMVILTSLTTERYPTLPYNGLTLDWYVETFTDRQVVSSILVSFYVGTAAGILATVVGTVAAFGFVRGDFPYKEELSTVILLPMVISPVIVGFALIRYFSLTNLPSGYPALIVGHTTLTLPFVFLLVRSQLLTFDRDLERASRMLGADRPLTFMNVTLPLMAPGILAGFFIAFILSFGEFTASQFLVEPGLRTIPIVIYNMLVTGLTPVVSVVATVLVVMMLLLAAIAEYLS